MVEVRMVKEELDRGRASLVALDESGLPIDAAFWFMQDDGRWQFYLHTPLIRKESKKSLYKRIRAAIGPKSNTLRLREITLLSDNSELLHTLRIIISTGRRGISSIRLTDNTVDGFYVRDALIYRI